MQQVPSRETHQTTPIPDGRRLVETVEEYERRLLTYPIDVFGATWDGSLIQCDPRFPESDGVKLGYGPPPFETLEVPRRRMRTAAVDLQLHGAAFNKYCTLVAARVHCRSDEVDLVSDWLIRGTPSKCGLCIADTRGGRYYYPVQAAGLAGCNDDRVDAIIAFEPFLQSTDYAVVHLADWTGFRYDELRARIGGSDLRTQIEREVGRPWLSDDASSRAEMMERLRDASPSDSLLERIRGWLGS